MTGAAPRISRRAVLAGGAGLAAVACLAGGYELVRDGALPGRYTLARMTGACGTALPRPARHPPGMRSRSTPPTGAARCGW